MTLRPALLLLPTLLVTVAGCAHTFETTRTPSGQLCADMPIVPANEKTERAYHRLGPLRSEPAAITEADRLYSLRRVACAQGADAVIEAANEESATGQAFSSGTGVVWTK